MTDQVELIRQFRQTIEKYIVEGDHEAWLRSYLLLSEKMAPSQFAIVAAAEAFGWIRAINERNAERNEKIAALESRIAELEARPSMKYLGVWRRDATYAVGNAVTHGGAIWIAKQASQGGQPGVDVDSWQLAVKGGRDGRDLR